MKMLASANIEMTESALTYDFCSNQKSMAPIAQGTNTAIGNKRRATAPPLLALVSNSMMPLRGRAARKPAQKSRKFIAVTNAMGIEPRILDSIRALYE